MEQGIPVRFSPWMRLSAVEAATKAGSRNQMTETSLWVYWVLTRGGKTRLDLFDVGRDLFYSNPWRGAPPQPKKNPVLSRVLVVGTNAEVSTILQGNPLARKSPSYQAYKKAFDQGIRRLKVDSVGTLEGFWPVFMGVDDFLGRPDDRSLPSLVVTTGFMRNYPRIGGETLEVADRLKDICKLCNVPIEFIPSFCS